MSTRSKRVEEHYDEGVDPPAPAITGEIINPVTERTLTVPLRVDTGFAGSLLLSFHKYDELGLRLAEDFEAVYGTPLDGRQIRLRQSHCHVKIYGVTQIITKAYTFPENTRNLIGRAVFNTMYAELRGPEKKLLVWT